MLSRNQDPLSNPYQALQLLSLARPDIEFFWLMDHEARYTGHHYDLFQKMTAWSKAQPRDLAWEKASLMYAPKIHHTWRNFTRIAGAIRDTKTRNGLQRTRGIEPIGPDRPIRLGRNNNWGVGEEADLITIAPISKPPLSEFGETLVIENYPDGENTPYRALSFPSMLRMSKRLLRAMHHGQITLGARMHPAMYPVSTALHHGLKVSSFPLPIFADAPTSAAEVEEKVNSNGSSLAFKPLSAGKDVRQRLTFAMGDDESPVYADELYKRWVGYDEAETSGLCLPGLLLYPIKNA